MADDFKTARPLEYYRKFLEKDVRPDGRNLEEFRPTILNIGCITTADGSTLVKLGNTTIMCGIKAEITTPKTEEPKKGFIVPNVELSPMCSPRFRPGPPSEQAQVLSQFVHEVIINSECINTEDLCIVPGKVTQGLHWIPALVLLRDCGVPLQIQQLLQSVGQEKQVCSQIIAWHAWVLYCDLLCLDYDGNVTDACVLALLAAFKNITLPKMSFDEETEKLETNLTQKSSLVIHTQPVSSTFAIFDDQILFVDPTVEEENLATGVITIVTTQDSLCLIRKPGGSPLSPSQLSDCIDRAFTRSAEVVRLIDETMNRVER